MASSLATDVGALLFRLYWPLELPSLPRGNFEDPIPRSGLIRTFGFGAATVPRAIQIILVAEYESTPRRGTS